MLIEEDETKRGSTKSEARLSVLKSQRQDKI